MELLMIPDVHQRLWLTCHDLNGLSLPNEQEVRALIRDVLPLGQRSEWKVICDRYDARDWPDWFVKEVGVDYE